MRLNHGKWTKGGVRLALTGWALLLAGVATAQAPDLNRLSQSGFIIKSTSTSYPTNPAWRDTNAIMSGVTVFDREVAAIAEVLCGTDQNKSVLLVGEASDTFKYVFSRMAMKVETAGCEGLSHVDIDINKIEAGNSLVGSVDAYWRDNILTPSDGKKVILYFSSLAGLMGIGSHKNDEDGIEKEYVANITAGRFRTVAYIDKYEYEYFARSRLAYVLNSFGRRVNMQPIAVEQVDELVQAYLRVLHPGFILTPTYASYLYKTAAYYQPNGLEPQRSMTILKTLIRSAGGLPTETVEKALTPAVETPHPYTPGMSWTQTIAQTGATAISMTFDMFKTFDTNDKLVVTSASGLTLDTFSGDKGAFTTPFYTGASVGLKFTSNDADDSDGFRIVKITYKRLGTHTFSRDAVRRAVMEVAQVPAWLIDRTYGVVKDLRSKLDGDVVGCAEAKNDVVRLAKAGYVGGRTDEKPIGSTLFVGPTGLGKSYVPKKMSDFMGMKLITIDMTSYRTPESFDRFLDAVATNLTLYPFAIYLFEEIDKADPMVLDRLYFTIDEGVFYDKYQRPLFARGAFVIMTTNAAEEILLTARPDDPTVRPRVNEELRKMFRPSFLNRFDAISLFFPFTTAEYRQLAKILIDKKMKKMKENFEWTVTLNQQGYDYVALKGQSPRYGARPMERLIENVITVGIADYQLEIENLDFGAQVAITKKATGENSFNIASNGKWLDYEVNPDVNGGNEIYRPARLGVAADKGAFWRQRLQQIFAADRVFED